MAAVDCSKPLRSKSTKPRALTLRDYEARKLAEDGRVLIVREVDAPQFGPNSGKAIREIVPSLLVEPGLWDIRYDLDNPRAVRCPLGPVGSPLWGREKWCPKGDGSGGVIWTSDRNAYEAYYFADGEDVSCLDGDGFHEYNKDGTEKSPWMSATSMPPGSSRFPRLRHESCEVKRADELTWDELAATGTPSLPDAIIGAFPGPAEYIEAAAVDPSAGPLMPPSGAWLWCSLVVDLDRLEVADA